MAEEKPKCPECETELVLVEGKPPEKCAKCGLNLRAYSGLARILDVYEKNKSKKKKQTESEDDGFLSILGKL